MLDGSGLVLAPAFVDPHVHLRTPGREDEETIATGTQAAAAGGYCTILAMPNTEPVVDSAAVLGALIEQARAQAEVQVGFLAAISKGQEGAELTEMGELADEGAVGFTDDGRPVVATSLMWRALQYSSITQRPLAVHCEDPTLSRGGHMREGIVSAELGIGGWPSIAESVMVERDLALASYEGRTLHLMHLSARASVEALRRAHAEGIRATAEVTPHHLVLTDEAVRSLDPNVKMNPPLGAEDDRQGARRGAPRRDDLLRRHRPRATRAAREGGAVRGGSVRRHGARDGVLGALHAPRRAGARLAGDAPRADVRRPGPRLRARRAEDRSRRAGEPRPARHAGELAGDRGRLQEPLEELVADRREAPRPRAGDDRRREAGARVVNGFLLLEDGTVFRGESVGAEGYAFGEAVFTTAMTGYQEVVTDPSYADQIVCFTAAMVGNYGVAPEHSESGAAHARAVVMREARGPAWTDWLYERGVVALTGIDTRSLVLHLRQAGSMRAIALAGGGLRGRGARERPRPASDGGPRARGEGLDARAVCLLRRGLDRGSRSSTTAASARS